MRQRASVKTQRRLKQQQQRDPYALTGDVHGEAPTFRVGGLVTAFGVLQLVAALALGGFVFGGALLLCGALAAALGLLLLLHQSDATGSGQGLGLKQALGRLLALRRSALDYSLTLSIAQSRQYKKEQLQISMVPSRPTPQNVVAAMALKQQQPVEKSKTTPLPGSVNMKALPTFNSFSEEESPVEKPRANSEPKQVRGRRPLLALKPKVQVAPVNAPQEKKQKKTQVKTTPVQPKTMVKQDMKSPQVQVKAQPTLKKPQQEPTISAKKNVSLPKVLPKAEPKVIIPAVLPRVKSVTELPKPKPVETAPATVMVEPFLPEATAPVIAPMPVFPELKSLVEVARGEPAVEKEVVVTRKVLLYLSPESKSVMDLEEEMEQELELEQEMGVEHELETFALSAEEFPPLAKTMVPQPPTPVAAINSMEPNFLMDIELEPISKPEKKLISIGSLRAKHVNNAELRTMIGELDAMRLELDAAMARCTSLLNGDGDKVSAPSLPDLEPEEEPIFCF